MEHFSAAIVNVSTPLIAVIAFKIALMAAMRLDVTALQMAALLAVLLTELLAVLLAVLVVSMLIEIVEKHLELKQMSTASWKNQPDISWTPVSDCLLYLLGIVRTP